MKLPETLEEKILFARVVYFPLCNDYLPGIANDDTYLGVPVTPLHSFCEALTMKVPKYSSKDESVRGTPWFIMAAYTLNDPDSEWINYGYGTSRILRELINSIRENRPYMAQLGSLVADLNAEDLIRQYQVESNLMEFLK